jgi:HlyD family secretion protein
VDGIVISRSVDVGQTVAASFQTPTLFTIAQDLTKMQVDTAVNEADIGKVKEGQNVEFSVDAYPDTVFKGTVFQVRNAPITVQNVVTYTVVIQVANPDVKLRPGMTANAAITTSLKKDVIRLPNAALRFRMPDKSGSRQPQKGQGIWVMEGATPKRVKVTTGISDGSFTEVVSGDAQEGMEAIVELVSKDKKPGASGTGSPSGSGRPPRMF